MARPAPAVAGEKVSLAEARRWVLLAQRPKRAGLAAASALFDQLGAVQIDSVNVICRSHELALWSRLGDHPRDTLPTLVSQQRIFEYWAHEASLVAVQLQPHLRWRMAAAHKHAWPQMRKMAARAPGYINDVLAEVTRRRRLSASELPGGTKKKSSWWGWDHRKSALEFLFWRGDVTAIRRPGTFERVYVPPDAVIPAHILSTPTPDPAEAQRTLLVAAARALGVGTAGDLADYFRINRPEARKRVAELVESATLIPVAVEGWREAAFVPAPLAQRSPPKVHALALLSPFDSLVWERARTERLFGFRYRLEIYTPAAKRRYGYYVLPLLLGEKLVARVDVKADRANAVLRVPAAYAEAGSDGRGDSGRGDGDLVEALCRELTAFAQWLGLTRVQVGRRGNLARPLRACATATLR